ESGGYHPLLSRRLSCFLGGPDRNEPTDTFWLDAVLQQGPAMPTLLVLQGADAGRRFDLTAPVLSVGRHSSNAVHLHDERVSRRHLELRRAATGGYQLFD